MGMKWEIVSKDEAGKLNRKQKKGVEYDSIWMELAKLPKQKMVKVVVTNATYERTAAAFYYRAKLAHKEIGVHREGNALFVFNR